MLNFEIEPVALASFIPAGTELDFLNGKTYVSLVGFLFQKTCIGGIRIPFHSNFEEVNLRFYVRRNADDGWRRGVVFIKELVPRRLIAIVAQKFYNENYFAVPMAHHIEKDREAIKSVSYFWQSKGRKDFLKVMTRGQAQPLPDDSLQEFIAEHYWGYAKQRDGSTVEYRVEHPRWRAWETRSVECHCDAADLYGDTFRGLFDQPPASAFLVAGSAVKVYQGVKLVA
jgi:uncharacterized protein YqjF (DUF2071 family)